jgi:excisionase family DNA binding protein
MANIEQLEELMGLLDGDVRLVDGSGHAIALATDVTEAFQTAVAEMLAGETHDLTTEEAAKLIGVSRPTLIRLLDIGAIPYRRTNGDHGHRRISRRAVLDHLRVDLGRRRQALDELAADAEAFGFFDE